MYIKDTSGGMVNSAHIIRIKKEDSPFPKAPPFMITADLTVGTAVLGRYETAAARDQDYKELEEAINETETILYF